MFVLSKRTVLNFRPKNIIKNLLKLFNIQISRPILFPSEANNFEKETIRVCTKFSMTGPIKMWAIIQSFKNIVNNNISGDFVECGVWKGGNLILFQKLIEKYNLTNRKIYGFDTFEGMPEPTNADVDFKENKAIDKFEKRKINTNSSAWTYASLEEVKNNYILNTQKNENLVLTKG